MCFYDGNFTFPSSFACFSRIKDKCGLIDFDVKEASFFVSTSSDKHLRKDIPSAVGVLFTDSAKIH